MTLSFATVLVVFRPGLADSDHLLRVRSAVQRESTPLSLLDLGARAYVRESRIAGLLGGCAMALAATLLCVCIALAINSVERQRHSVAVRQALGSRVWPLTVLFTWPVILGSITGGVLAGSGILVLGPLWRVWGGLASPLGPVPYLVVLFGLLVPIVVTLLSSQLLLRTVRPGESLKSAIA
jgi:hypothetical protein